MVLRKHELEGKLGEESQMIKSGVIRDENPLDTSVEFNSFIEACRRGSLKRCQELIDAGVNINGKDRFDYTPLIVASLCGHYELVLLLLESGALAERGTFQGERCIYNALNDRIRNLLQQWNFSKSSDPYVYWVTHLSSLLTRATPQTADIALTAGSSSFQLHKFILASRTPYFQRKLEAQPETTAWTLAAAVPSEALQIALRYVYLGDLPRDLVGPGSATSEEEVAKGLDKISKHLGIEQLWDAILASGDRRLARQRYQDEVQRALDQIKGFFEKSVLKHKMVVDVARVQDVRWKHDNSIFADVLLRADEPEEAQPEETPESDAPISNGIGIPLGIPSAPPVPPRRAVLYPAHKAMLLRSEYFATMFSSDFLEGTKADHLHVISVDCSPPVLELILAFLYTENSACPLEHALELLYTADMLLLDTLKGKAAQAISTLGSGDATILVDRTHDGSQEAAEMEPVNIYDVIHAAWDLRVQRLEEFSARYLAYRLEDYIDEQEFQDLIQESASRLASRQDTDTIELLDDIRYYLSERFRLRFEDAGLDDMMDAEGEIPVEKVEALAIAAGDMRQSDVRPETGDAEDAAKPPTKPNEAETKPDGAESDAGEVAAAIKTLDGQDAEDEFASDAMNYQILLGKIDAMLDRLKLDA